MMYDASAGKQYSWAMKDANVLARSFDTPDILEAYTAVIVKPGQEALVFTDDQQMHLREIGTHLITGSLRVNIRQAFEILRNKGTVHTSFSSAITIFDTRTRLLPTENLTLQAADGSEVHLSFGGAYRIANPLQMVMNAMSLKPCAEEGVNELRTDDAFVQDVIGQIRQIATEELTRAALEAPDAAEAKKRLPRGDVSEGILRRINEAIRATGFLLERFRPMLTERTCPYCSHPLSLMEMRSRRCGECERTLECCPECGSLVSQEHAVCHTCKAPLLWCDRCRTFAQVEKGRFCIRCHTACYPLLPRELLQHN